ncbi:CGNR zinc finger domain-containing protein [Streptomyces sp. GMY02]|uniref:CGNR zinc finger domain-containing protein n=1 Tax=Streptomyces sp. GMY02 TaxID=1333528 RepID=UPI0020B7F6D5|nr:CGNR zinc finger domain-containing protein [Streptomyces sp. GMY02]
MREAPDGLALVQDLINTRAIRHYAPDLLAGRESAEEWLTGAAGAWARIHGLDVPDCSLSEADPAALRDLRTTFQELIAGTGGDTGSDAGGHTPTSGSGSRSGKARTAGRGASVRLAPDVEGRVRMVPVGRGRQWLESALWSETLLAQRNGTWPRLKMCRNTECASAFYDTSRNNSGVWHDAKVCGNAVNLRASRERKRLRESGAS